MRYSYSFCSRRSRRNRSRAPRPEKVFGFVPMRLSPKGYPQFFHPHERRWVFTHRWVMEQIFGGPIFPGLVVHHKDRNKRNFHPSNLQVMTVGEHDHLHGFDR